MDNSWILGFWDSWIPGFWDLWILGLLDSWISENPPNPVLISSSSKSPRAAMHMNGCTSRWEYGLPKFQNKLWKESRVTTETVPKPYHFNEIRDAHFQIIKSSPPLFPPHPTTPSHPRPSPPQPRPTSPAHPPPGFQWGGVYYPIQSTCNY